MNERGSGDLEVVSFVGEEAFWTREVCIRALDGGEARAFKGGLSVCDEMRRPETMTSGKQQNQSSLAIGVAEQSAKKEAEGVGDDVCFSEQNRSTRGGRGEV